MGYASLVRASGELIEYQSHGHPDVLLANAMSAGLAEADIEIVAMSAEELAAVRASIPTPDGQGFLVSLIAALGDDPTVETAVSRAYPQFFEYIRFGNWPRVQWCITNALTAAVISQTQYDAIKTAALAHHIPIEL